MTAQILEFPIIPLKAADRCTPKRSTEERFQTNRIMDHFECPKCGDTCEAQRLFVVAYIHCDNCGAEMRPVGGK